MFTQKKKSAIEGLLNLAIALRCSDFITGNTEIFKGWLTPDVLEGNFITCQPCCRQERGGEKVREQRPQSGKREGSRAGRERAAEDGVEVVEVPETASPQPEGYRALFCHP